MPAEAISGRTAAALEPVLGSALTRFSHHDNATNVLPGRASDLHVVTGFGPTNAPTAGTLSVMLGIVELQRTIGSPVTVVVSELGAWNSRNVPWEQLCAVRDQMLNFLRALGFDENQGDLRSHLDLGNLARAGKIARFLTRKDFLDHREELMELYEDHGLLGSEIGLTVDALYTVADILGPAEAGNQKILMVSGLEEAYFTELARVVLDRQRHSDDVTLGWNAHVGALYFRVLEGLAGYPKMSKSIPESSIHLGMDADALADRVMSDDPSSQQPLLSAIELASGWPPDDIREAKEAFEQARADPRGWRHTKERFLASFCAFADLWRKSAP